jgi:hypothetical protein
MPLWLQHTLVLLIAGAAVFVLLRQGIATLRGRGKLGSCCAKGCEPQAAPKGDTERIAFLPAESLSRRRPK